MMKIAKLELNMVSSIKKKKVYNDCVRHFFFFFFLRYYSPSSLSQESAFKSKSNGVGELGLLKVVHARCFIIANRSLLRA